MQPHRRIIVSAIRGTLCMALLAGFMPLVQAADVTGTWTWTTPGRQGGEPRTYTLTLKAEAEKLTGKLSTPGRQGGEPRVTEITEGKVAGDQISFTIKRQMNETTFVTKYSGKVAGDVIKGKSESERDGQKQEREWEAKRQAAK